MKRKSIVVLLCALVFVAMSVIVFVSIDKSSRSELTDVCIEALTNCEITKGDNVKFRCSGDGKCSVTYMGHTLTCDGTKE